MLTASFSLLTHSGHRQIWFHRQIFQISLAFGASQAALDEVK